MSRLHILWQQHDNKNKANN